MSDDTRRQEGIARIEVPHGETVLYGDTPFELPVRLLDRAGRNRSLREVSVQVSHGFSVRLLPHAIVCKRAGIATIEVRTEQLRESFQVRCRQLKAARGWTSVEMTVGDPPRPLEFDFEFSSGERERVRPRRIDEEDGQVARMQSDSIVAVAPGRTTLWADFGGRVIQIAVSVSSVFMDDTVSLHTGQFRNWLLDPGHYRLTFSSLRSEHAARALQVITDGMRCLRDLRTEDSFDCVVYERGAVVLRAISTRTAGHAQRAYVRIIRTP